MIIGVDFDNTIVCYDGLFHRVATERGLLPSDIPVSKTAVRDHLRRTGQEEVWTEMQGLVYGPRLCEAEPYPGVLEFFRTVIDSSVPLRIISHKTRHPFLGEPHDLHEAALSWLALNGFFDPSKIGMSRDSVFLELTKENKHRRIASCGCTHFVDDLPEFLLDPGFPAGVARLHFDPHGHGSPTPALQSVHSWDEVKNALLRPIPDDVAAFSRECLNSTDVRLQPLPGGGNNRIFRATSGDSRLVIKAYHHDPADPRDRFATEHAFYQLIEAANVGGTAQAVAWDSSRRLGALAEIQGRKLLSGEVTADHVNQAASWINRLQGARNHPLARGLHPASEACFTVEDHVASMEHRILRLLDAVPTSKDPEFAAFVNDELVPTGREIAALVRANAGSLLKHLLPEQQRCLSPSDVGFHNSLLNQEGRLCFFDFEYAGWDDPAKLACDFICQPQFTIPAGLSGKFVLELARIIGDSTIPERVTMLLPVHQVKWTCIMLNEFLKDGAVRRQFAGLHETAGNTRRSQLGKARHMLEGVSISVQQIP